VGKNTSSVFKKYFCCSEQQLLVLPLFRSCLTYLITVLDLPTSCGCFRFLYLGFFPFWSIITCNPSRRLSGHSIWKKKESSCDYHIDHTKWAFLLKRISFCIPSNVMLWVRAWRFGITGLVKLWKVKFCGSICGKNSIVDDLGHPSKSHHTLASNISH
jgi:hypothetical protein